MSGEDESNPTPILRLMELRCRRLDRMVDLDEHESCPYCFGYRREIASGRYETFCDWQAARDPVQFGFPPGLRRELNG